MQGNSGRLAVLVIGSALASGGWGTILPYLYADVATARGLGGTVAAMTFTAFAIGSLLAAPVAGRLADRSNAAKVAGWSRVVMAVGTVGMGLASTGVLLWLAAAVTGAAFAIALPSVQVMLLRLAGPAQRRDVFAWQFIASNLALALGGFVGGLVIDLNSPTGSRPVYAMAVATCLASAVAVGIGGRGHAPLPCPTVAADGSGLRGLLASRPIRLLLGLVLLITLAGYAQYDSGLPAYSLGRLRVSSALLGSAVALNALLVAVLTAPVLRLTRRYNPAVLLAWCAGVWVLCWLMFALPLIHSGSASAMVIGGYALFSVGETMMAPVLAPLAAALAPADAVGRALAAVSGVTTLAEAVGPALSGVLLALDVPVGFIVLQLACCAGAIAIAARLAGQTPRAIEVVSV